ncbi:hypothetical protein H0H87_011620 [Tephrocybe sp. NHM501043]|nr:hypothetical protein H0H87_011620 [Tephrocybe sp. NHM501043]
MAITTYSRPGTIAAKEHRAPTTSELEGPAGRFSASPLKSALSLIHCSPNGGFVDQSGVALTSGGGTLVLGTSGNTITPPREAS